MNALRTDTIALHMKTKLMQSAPMLLAVLNALVKKDGKVMVIFALTSTNV